MSFMQKAESGDLTTRYWGNRQDEVGMLGRGFNRMLLQIRKLMKLSERGRGRSVKERARRLTLSRIFCTTHWIRFIGWPARKGGRCIGSGGILVAAVSDRAQQRDDIIPMSDEWTHISSYLQIQKTRYRDRSQVEMELCLRLRNCMC